MNLLGERRVGIDENPSFRTYGVLRINIVIPECATARSDMVADNDQEASRSSFKLRFDLSYILTANSRKRMKKNSAIITWPSTGKYMSRTYEG